MASYDGFPSIGICRVPNETRLARSRYLFDVCGYIDFDVGHFIRWLIAFQYTSVARYKELSEVPFNVVVSLQPCIKRMSIGAIHLDLVELRELDVEVGRAELMNFLNRSRSLLPKLVAGEVQNLQSLAAVFLIERLQFLVLRRESKLSDKNSANRVQKAGFMPRCSLFSQILFAKIVIFTELSLYLHRHL